MDQGTNVNLHMYGTPKMIRTLMGPFEMRQPCTYLAQVICASCFGMQLGYKLLGGDCPSLRMQEPSVHGGLAGTGPFTPTPPPSPPPLPGNWLENAGEWAPKAPETNFA